MINSLELKVYQILNCRDQSAFVKVKVHNEFVSDLENQLSTLQTYVVKLESDFDTQSKLIDDMDQKFEHSQN